MAHTSIGPTYQFQIQLVLEEPHNLCVGSLSTGYLGALAEVPTRYIGGSGMREKCMRWGWETRGRSLPEGLKTTYTLQNCFSPVIRKNAINSRNDVFGRIAAWISQIPLIVGFSVLCLVFFHRDLHTIFYAVGMLANEAICKISKKIIRIPRPPTHPQSLVSSYGMPSNHATFMFFMMAYFSLFIKFRLSPRHYSTFARCFTVLFLFLISVITCYTRVYLEFHYVDQVCIGALVGSILGCLWFYVVQVILTPLFPRIVESKIGRTLMLQDFTHIPNIFTFEYNAVRASRPQ
ncbi:unnamed protein product [Taenia asiatica]|uniref:Dolichyldiphosphatase 1 n=1 Tax=Taenia asiatica TaxID=60517 RepID=A0A158R9V1_TAEAS|nr:unnamed protein product [Taenia asiatica]